MHNSIQAQDIVLLHNILQLYNKGSIFLVEGTVKSSSFSNAGQMAQLKHLVVHLQHVLHVHIIPWSSATSAYSHGSCSSERHYSYYRCSSFCIGWLHCAEILVLRSLTFGLDTRYFHNTNADPS